MPSTKTILRRLRGTIRSSAFEDGMDAELQMHLELEAEVLVARGMDPREASCASRRRGSASTAPGVSVKELAAYRSQTQSLDAIVEYHQMAFNLLGRGEAARVC